MSRLYATISADRSEATRTSSHTIQATAQSYEGSVAVLLYGKKEEPQRVRITAANGSVAHPSGEVWDGTLAELIAAGRLVIQP